MKLSMFAYRSLILLTCTGCAEFTHFNKQTTVENNQAVFVDAKQRAIFKVYKSEVRPGQVLEYSGYCAEPSPDTFSALAATLGVDLTITDKGKLGLSNSISESVGALGIRTAAIAALRDIMYRNCEAYAVGGISKIGLETLQRRFQSTMVAILAIEQLTGAVRQPAIILGGSSSAGSPDVILELTTKAEAARKSWDDAKVAESTVRKKYDTAIATRTTLEKEISDGKIEADRISALTAPSTEETKKLADYKSLSIKFDASKKEEATIKTEYEQLSAATLNKEQAYVSIESSRAAALSGGGRTISDGKIEALPQKAALSDAAVTSMSQTVENIVKSVTSELKYSGEMCTTLLGEYPNETPQPGSTLELCLAILAKAVTSKSGENNSGLPYFRPFGD